MKVSFNNEEIFSFILEKNNKIKYEKNKNNQICIQNIITCNMTISFITAMANTTYYKTNDYNNNRTQYNDHKYGNKHIDMNETYGAKRIAQ